MFYTYYTTKSVPVCNFTVKLGKLVEFCHWAGFWTTKSAKDANEGGEEMEDGTRKARKGNRYGRRAVGSESRRGHIISFDKGAVDDSRRPRFRLPGGQKTS